MSSHFRVYSLDVGQGMSTLFAVYDKDGKVTALALFDLGSSHNSKTAGRPTLEFLKNMALQRESPNGHIDAIFISHKDKDHVSLLYGNQTEVDPLLGLLQLLPNMTIGRVRYGGRYSWYDGIATVKKKSVNLLTLLKARTFIPDFDVRGFPVGASNYRSDFTEGRLWGGEDFGVFLLAANTPYKTERVGTEEDHISTRPDGDQANSKSLVLVLAVNAGSNHYCAVIGGDATFPTFQYINSFFDGTIPNCYMVLLPHHGSRRTTFGLNVKDAVISDVNREVVKTYAQRMAGKTVIASADIVQRYGHPSLETSQLFLDYAETKAWWSDPLVGDGRHFTTTNIDYALQPGLYDQRGFKTILTSQNLYSTLYYDSTKVSSPMVAFSPYIGFTTPPYSASLSFSAGMNWIYTLLPRPLDFLIDFRGVTSNRLPSDESLIVRSAEELLTTHTFVYRASGTPAPPSPAAPAAAVSPRQDRPANDAGRARAPAQPHRLAPRLTTPFPAKRP